jgi:hypothetical protein
VKLLFVSHNHMEHTNTLFEQNALLVVISAGVYSDNCVLQGCSNDRFMMVEGYVDDLLRG